MPVRQRSLPRYPRQPAPPLCAQISTVDSITNLPAIQHISESQTPVIRAQRQKQSSSPSCHIMANPQILGLIMIWSGHFNPPQWIENLMTDPTWPNGTCSKCHYATFQRSNDDPNDRIGREWECIVFKSLNSVS